MKTFTIRFHRLSAIAGCLMGGLVLVGTGRIQASPPASPAFIREISILDHQSIRLMLSGQYAKLSSIDAAYELPTFCVTYANGRVLNRPQHDVEEAAEHSRVKSVTQCSATLVSVRADGFNYVTEYTEFMAGIYKDHQKNTSPFSESRIVRNYWVKQGEQWRIGGAEELELTETVGGKSYHLKARGPLAF